MVRYYSILRPVSLGTYPLTDGNMVLNIVNYDEKEYIEEIGRMAWGHIEYSQELPELVAKGYDLVRGSVLPKTVKVAGNNNVVFEVNNECEKFVMEYCANCDTEVFIRWDVQKSGFKAYCPYCGNVLMLCDECQHRNPNVDYTDASYRNGDNDCDWNCHNDKKCMMNR